MRRVILILFSPKEQRRGGKGGALLNFYFLFLSLFSRPRAGLATVLKVFFFGLTTYTLNVRNNKTTTSFKGNNEDGYSCTEPVLPQ